MFQDYLLYVSLIVILLFIVLPFILNFFNDKSYVLVIGCENDNFYVYETETEIIVEDRKLLGLIKNRQKFDEGDDEYILIKDIINRKSLFTF